MKLMENWKRFWTLNRHHAAGFTLVELIVVIAILAILAGVAVPAYSGYIAEANKAADEQLLDALNTAFASACAINGENHYNRNAQTTKAVPTTVDGGTQFSLDTENDIIDASFTTYFEGGVFKVFTKLKYDPAVGMFVDDSTGDSALLEALQNQPELLEKLMNSNLGSLGAETMLTEMGNVLDWAVNDLHLQGGSAFEAFYYELLDFDPSQYDLETEDGAMAAQLALNEKIGALGGDAGKVYANAMALYAAEKSSGVTLEGVSGWLGQSEDAFLENQTGSALGNAAAIYALYLSYKGEDYNAESTNAGNIFFNGAMNDAGFAAWINDPNSTAQAELEAFKAAMALASGDEAKKAVLENGFDDPEMIEILGSLIGK